MKGKLLQPPSMASSTKASRVPDVGGGPSTSMSIAGSALLISFQVLYGLGTRLSEPSGFGTSLASAMKISARLMSSCSALTELATAMPSKPISTSITSVTPLLWHISNSLDLMRRDEFVMSGVLTPRPEQKSLSPPPEPVDSIFGVAKSEVLPKRSATTVANGKTVEEPTTLMLSRACACVTKPVASTADEATT